MAALGGTGVDQHDLKDPYTLPGRIVGSILLFLPLKAENSQCVGMMFFLVYL